MGLFDGFGPDFAPADANGWQTAVTKSTDPNSDPNNLSLAEKIRLGFTGSTDQNKDIANVGGALAKGLPGMLGAKPPGQPQQQPAAAAPANPHAGEGANFAQQLTSGQSPFAAASATPVGQKRPMTSAPLYTSPFAAAPMGQS